jgi:hypothetical protein
MWTRPRPAYSQKVRLKNETEVISHANSHPKTPQATEANPSGGSGRKLEKGQLARRGMAAVIGSEATSGALSLQKDEASLSA